MPASVRTPDTAPPLVFDWKRERGVRRRLAMWLLVVVMGLAAMFYLFRVTTPLTARKPPPQQAVLYLPAAEPEVRALLGKIGDRFPGTMRVSADDSMAMDLQTLAKVTPAWEPTWAAHRAVLKPFPLPPVPQELPPVFTAGSALLPQESSLAPLTPAGNKVKPSPFLAVESTEGGRTVVRPPAWPDQLTDETWPVTGSVPFMLGLDRHGRVEYCLPVSPATGLDLEALRRVLMAVRFSPVSSGVVEWIHVAVRW
jgi:hypothetical protein